MSEKPKICPFLTIANSQVTHRDGRTWECEEENCALWCEWTKCCALVAIPAEIHDRIGELTR